MVNARRPRVGGSSARGALKEFLSNGMKYGNLVLGPILIVIALVLFTVCTYGSFTSTGPVIADTFTPAWWAMVLVGVTMLCNALFNYFLCLTTPAGCPQDIVVDIAAPQQGGAVAPAAVAVDPRESGSFSKTCSKCGHFKPDRTHHDSVTGECVLRFDHYCPWLFNAVGFGNYKYFFLFLLWLWAVCVFCAAVAAPAFLWRVYAVSSHNAILAPGSSADKEQVLAALGAHADTAMVLRPWVPRKLAAKLSMMCFVLPLAVGIAVGVLLAWHAFLIATNQTTIEWYANSTKRQSQGRGRSGLHAALRPANVYTMGWVANWKLVFGVPPWDWRWVLPSFAPPPGNGVEYPTLDHPAIMAKQLADWHSAYGGSLLAYLFGLPAGHRGPPTGYSPAPQPAADATALHQRTHAPQPASAPTVEDMLWGGAGLQPQGYDLLDTAVQAGFTRTSAPSMAGKRVIDAAVQILRWLRILHHRIFSRQRQ